MIIKIIRTVLFVFNLKKKYVQQEIKKENLFYTVLQ